MTNAEWLASLERHAKLRQMANGQWRIQVYDGLAMHFIDIEDDGAYPDKYTFLAHWLLMEHKDA